MTTISLHEYLNRIEKLIEDGQLTEAAAHCRNILELHPRHIDTYRLLAKALLEQHNYEDALDLFQRILSADPNDFIAHVGMSIINSENSQLDQSLWHLERAFEIQPYNAAIQEELRRHYAQNSDLAVDRIPLTSGALARLYIQGELYHQAVQELSKVLKDERDRVDLEVLLAEALWRNDQRIDAEEVCLEVLQKLPNCIVVNAILSEIWLQTGRIGESQKYLQRLQQLTNLDKVSLNLDTAVGRAFFTEGAPPLPDEITLEFKGEFEPLNGETAVAAKGPSADWMSEVSFDEDMSKEFEYGNEPGIVEETESGMHSYDWMSEVNAGIVSEEEDLPKPETEWFMDESLSEEEPSDWLLDADEGAVEGALDIEDEFKRLFDENTADDGLADTDDVDLDWLQDEVLAPENSDDLPSEAEEGAPGWLNDLIVDADGGELSEDSDEPAAVASDWFADVSDESEPVLDSESEESILSDLAGEDSWESDSVGEETPDWLQSVGADDAEAEPALEMVDSFDESDVEDDEEAAESDIPDWLADHATDVGATLAQTSDSEPEQVDLDDWLADVDGIGESSAEAVGQEDEGSDLAEFPAATGTDSDWLAAPEEWMEDLDEFEEMASDSEPSPSFEQDEAVANAQEEIPDWLQGDEQEEASMMEGVVTGDKEDKEEKKQPEFDLNAEDMVDQDEDWLSALGGEVVSADEEEDDLFAADDTAVPDWLADEPIPDTVEAEEVAAHGGLTAWLSDPKDDDAVPSTEAETSDFDEEAAEAGLTAWLSEGLDDEDTLATADEIEGLELDDAAERGLTSWLAEMSDDVEEAAEMPAGLDDLDDDVADSGLTSWLAESADMDEEAADEPLNFDGLDEEAAESGLTSWLSKMSEEDADEIAEVVETDDTFVEDELTSWIDDDAEEESDLSDELSAGLVAAAVSELTEDDDDELDWDMEEGGLTDWLSEEIEDVTAVEAAVHSEPMDEIIDDIPDIPSEELFATDQENLPDWLSDQPADPSELDGEEADLPDWLADVDSVSSDLPPALDSDDLLDSDGLSDISDDLFADFDDEEATAVASETAEPTLEFEPEEEEGLTAAGLTELLSETDGESSALADLDLDTDVPWLDDLAAEAETVEDVDVDLDWLSGEDSSTSASVMDMEDVPETAVPELEEEEADAGELVDIGVDGSLEDVDDAMSWLEDLASQQETPVDDMPTVAEDLLAAELNEIEMALADTEDVDLDEGEGEAESWLDVLMSEEEEEDIEDDDEITEPPEDMEDAMAWLEGLAAKQGAPIEELPSQQHLVEEEYVSDFGEFEGELEDMETWLQDIQAEQEEEPADELDEELAEALDFLEEQVKAEGITPSVNQGTEVSDNELADALDWLEASTAVQSEEISEPDQFEEVLEDEDIFEEIVESVELAEEEAALAVDLDEPELEAAVMADLADAEVDDSEDIDLFDMPDDPEDAMAWLEQMSGDDGEIEFELEPPPITPSEDAAFADIDYGGSKETAEEEEAEPESVLLEETAEAAEEIAADITQIDELVVEKALEAEEDIDIFDMPDDPDAAMAWLEQMADGDGAIEFDMEPPPITPSEDAAFADIDYGGTKEEATAVVEDEEEEETEAEPELLVAEDADIVAEVTAEADEIADFDMFDMPDDPDEAMNWLEAMAGGEGEIEFDMEPPPISPSEDAAFADIDYGGTQEEATAVVDEDVEDIEEDEEEPPVDVQETILAEETAAAISEAEDLFDLADDDEDAMAWLEAMTGGSGEIEFDMEPPPISPSEDAAFADIDYGGTKEEPPAEDVAEFVQPEDDVLADVPDDPDEAMAWLEKMAAQQTSEMEDEVGELPLIADTPVPAWLHPDEDEPQLPDVSDVTGTQGQDDLDIIENLGVDIDDDLSDSLPDWFSMDSQSSPASGQTGWLRSLEEIDVGSWLEAEEEATGTEVDADVSLPDTGEIASATKKSTGPLPALPQEPDLPAESPEVTKSTPSGSYEVDDANLSLARSALEEARFDDAVGQYQQLIASGTGTMALINELESVAEDYPNQPALRRLLGDAYMRNGQLQKALNTYRDALDHL